MKSNFLHSFLILALIVAVGIFAMTGNPVPLLFMLFAPWQFSKRFTFGQFNAPGAELLRRRFTAEIQPLLFPSSSFLNRALNDDEYVNDNTVELAHSGTLPDATVNRTVLPATVVSRTDVPTNYTLEELTTDPTLIGYSESLLVNYNKRQDILKHKAKIINTKAANRILSKWAAGATAFIPTTGATRPASADYGQTGVRKKMTIDQWMEVKQRFHKHEVVSENEEVNGVALLTAEMLTDMLSIQAIYDASQYGKGTLPSGVVARILGFDVMVRSSVLKVSNAGALKAEGAAGAATDQNAAFFWHPDYVRRAKGAIKFFIDEDKPEYYGSLMSSLLRMGGIPARNDNKGTYIVYEDDNV